MPPHPQVLWLSVRAPVSRQSLARLARGPVASAASQAAGLVQVGLLLVHGGATNATDTYFYLFALGLTPTQILIVGVMYPLLLNGDSLTPRGLVRLRRVTPALAAISVLAAYAWLALNRDMGAALHVIAAVMSLNAVLQARLHYRACAAEAGGDSLWIPGIALPANLAACISLALPWSSSTAATTAMVSALATGNAACLWFMTRRRIGQHVIDAVSGGAGRSRGSGWFFAKSAVGYLSHVVLTSVAVTLPASGVTVLSLANRLVGAVATTLTNAVMPLLVHQATETPSAARRFLRLLSACLAGLGVVATAATGVLAPDHVIAAAVVSVWVVASSAAAVAQRTSFRFLPARAAGATMAAVLVIVAATVAISTTFHFTVVVLLCSYVALDASTAGLLLWRLKDKGASAVAILALVCLTVVSWVSLT